MCSSSETLLYTRQLGLKFLKFCSILWGHVWQDHIESRSVHFLIGNGYHENAEKTSKDPGNSMKIVNTTAIMQVNVVKKERL